MSGISGRTEAMQHDDPSPTPAGSAVGFGREVRPATRWPHPKVALRRPKSWVPRSCPAVLSWNPGTGQDSAVSAGHLSQQGRWTEHTTPAEGPSSLHVDL